MARPNTYPKKTSFPAGAGFIGDSDAGLFFMEKNPLLAETAQNALAGNVAPAFDPTRDEDHKYIGGERVAYDGKVYVFNVDHYGAWNASHVTAINEDEATKNIGGCSCRLVGAGDTAVMTKIFVREGSFVRIVPRQTTWDTTGVVAPHVKFAVRRRTTAGSYVDFVSVAIANDVPSVIDVEIPTGTAWIEIFVRAAVGKNLYFDAFSYTAVQEKNYPNITLFEMGNVAISSSSLIYSSSTTRARAKINTLIKVKKGDVFGVEAGFQMYVAFTQNGLSPYATKGWTDTFTCPEDGFVALVLRKGVGSDSPTTFEELMGNFYIRAFNSDLATLPYLVKTINSCGVSIKETYWGYNSNPVSKTFKIPSNVIFRLTLSRTIWEVASIGTYNRFIVRKVLLDDSSVDLFIASKTDIVPPVLDFVADSNVKAIKVLLRIDTGYSVDVQTQCIEQRGLIVHARNAAFRSVNHRGYNTIAPENTLPAFRLSAKMGFGIVETDVRLTSDGKFVCIHDATVNRTSNGSGNVADMTLDQLKALDFGSWKSADYAGTKIPTYEEFLVCCRNLGLDVYVEIKEATGHYDELLDITRRLGMKSRTTFIADSGSKLVQINNRDTSYRIGYAIASITPERVANAQAMFADNKNLFIDVDLTNTTDSDIALVEAAGIPLEVWTVDSEQTIMAMNPYISGVTSNSVVASDFLYSYELGK